MKSYDCDLGQVGQSLPFIHIYDLDYRPGITDNDVGRRPAQREGLQRRSVRRKSGRVAEKMLPKLVLVAVLAYTWTTGFYCLIHLVCFVFYVNLIRKCFLLFFLLPKTVQNSNQVANATSVSGYEAAFESENCNCLDNFAH